MARGTLSASLALEMAQKTSSCLVWRVTSLVTDMAVLHSMDSSCYPLAHHIPQKGSCWPWCTRLHFSNTMTVCSIPKAFLPMSPSPWPALMTWYPGAGRNGKYWSQASCVVGKMSVLLTFFHQSTPPFEVPGAILFSESVEFEPPGPWLPGSAGPV